MTTYRLLPPDGSDVIELTPEQYDRFFDNRDPTGWRVHECHPVVPGAWRPIARAPRDGSWILATRAARNPYMVQVRWMDGGWRDDEDRRWDGLTDWRRLPAGPHVQDSA